LAIRLIVREEAEMSDVRFFTTGFVTPQRKGPLSVTLLTPTGLIVVEVVFGAPAIASRLGAGEPVVAVLDSLKSLQKTETIIPIERLQSVRWIDGQNATRIRWLDESGRTRRKTTSIAIAAHRTQLLEQLAAQIGHRPRETAEPAGIWSLAADQLGGAALTVVCMAVLLFLWDPQLIAGARGGRIVLWLGPIGCTLVVSLFVICLLLDAWRRLSPRPMEHCWTV
jgi:hypothetical protein